MTTWLDIEGIMLREMSNIEKDKHSMISIMHRILKKRERERRNSKQHRVENR